MAIDIRVGILTTFYNFNSSYSLTTVVKQQLIALVKYGYKPVLFVLDNFVKEELSNIPEGVEVRQVIPQLILEPYTSWDLSNLDKDVEKAKIAFESYFKDIDVCLTHDIIFINSFLPYNVALRQAQETVLKNVKFLHWMHSGPSARPTLDGSVYDNLYTLPKNSRLVYMNYSGALGAAEMYGVYPNMVNTIFNPMDIRVLHNFTELSKKIIDAHDLMSPEILIVYPLSTTRMGVPGEMCGKQLDKVLRIMGGIKNTGMTCKLVVCNAHANAEREKEAIERMYKYAETQGLKRGDVVFTSLFDVPNNENGVPHDVVRDMFVLSNVFIFPSESENCPLILLEAMSTANILLLNDSFAPMKDFVGKDALYAKFGSINDTPNHPRGEGKYYEDMAKILVNEYRTNKAVSAKTKLRREFNIDAIFKRQLEPSILELYYGE